MNKMIQNYILKSLFVFFISLSITFGQSGNYIPKIIPPSPNAASLGKYGDIPVSYYTGLPNISIPIYEIQDKAGNHSISISYHASGIKVAEEASRVGLGWALNAGGVISRNIIGGDDFEATNYFGGTDLPKEEDNQPLTNIQLSSNFIAKYYNKAVPNAPTFQNINLENAIKNRTAPEFEPDIYNFNFGGVSGKFVITKNKEVILQEKKKIKIEMIEGATVGNYGDNIKWKITTDNGTSYFFDEKETSIDGNSKFHVNSWYLTKIKTVEGNEITFKYTTVPSTRVYSQGAISENMVYTVLGKICQTNSIPPSFTPNRASSNTYSLIYLSEIVFTNGKVVFTYNTDSDKRLDVDGDKKLNKVSIYKNDVSSANPILLKDFYFKYGYFEGGNDPDYVSTGFGSLSKRLKLSEIGEIVGTDSLPPHKFTYYEGDNYNDLPAKTSFAIDHWGYYNGQSGNRSLIPSYTILPSEDEIAKYTGVLTGIERDSDPSYVRAFSLQKIQYPTGGQTELVYEANEFDYLASQERDYSIVGKNALSDIGKNQVFFNWDPTKKNQIQEFEIDMSDAITQVGGKFSELNLTAYSRFGNPVPCNDLTNSGQVYFEIIDKSTSASITKVDMFSSKECATKDDKECIYKECKSTVSNGPLASSGISYQNTFSLKPGKYILKVFIASSIKYDVMNMPFTFTYSLPKSKMKDAKGYTGGLRIKRISNYDGSKTETTDFQYNLMDSPNSKRSSGIRMSAPQYSYWENTYVFDGTSQTAICSGYNNVLRRTSNSIFPLNASASGSVVGYSVVTVQKVTDGKSQGKTTYFYDNKPDIVNDYGYFRTPQNATIPYERNGNLLKEQVFNGQGKKVKETNYSYSQGTVKPTIIWGLDKRVQQYYAAGATENREDDFFFYPSLKSTFTFLQEKNEMIFDLSDTSKVIKNKETYTYDESTHFQIKEKFVTTSKLLSDGSAQRIQTLFKYPSDFSATGNVYEGMIGQHNYSAVISEQTLLETNNGSSKVFNQIFLKKVEYKKWKDGRTINAVTYPSLYEPEKILTQQRTADKISEEVTFLNYNDFGSPLKYRDKNKLFTTIDYYTNIATDKGFLYLPSQKVVGGGTDGQLLSDKTITKYSYYPLIGLKSIIDPNNKTTTYNYDVFGRLKTIADDGGILKEYNYHYGLQKQKDDYVKISKATGLNETVQECKMCCLAEASAGSNSPIVNCSSGQIALNSNGSSTGDDVRYSWSGPNNFTSTEKNPIVTGDITKYGGVYTLTVSKYNSTCDVKSTATTKVVLDCACPFTINTTGTTLGPLACQSTISLVGNCNGCSTGELVAGTETYVTNGKFDNATTPGFTSECPTYFTPNPQSIVGTFKSFGNHSSNSGGNMLLIGHSTNADEKVWSQTVTVQANTRYILSAWITAAYDNNATKVYWEVNGTVLSEYVDMTNKIGGQWQQLKSVWISGSQTSVTITLRKRNTFGHNWFAIDDISMTNVLQAASYEWTGPDNFSATGRTAFIRNVGLKNGGTYQLKVINNGCTKVSEVSVAVNCQPCLDTNPLTVYVNSNSPVSCGSQITLFASANKRNVNYTWYKLNPDGSDTPLPDAEKNKQNPSVTAPSVAGLNRVGYMVAAFKDGCTASYTTPVEIKCIEDGDVDLSMNLRTESGITSVVAGQLFNICADLKNESTTRSAGSVRARVVIPECLEFVGPTWGFNTGAHEELSGLFYEDIWYNPTSREISNLSPKERRGADVWQYWGVPVGPNSTRTMCFGVKALNSGTIVVKGQVAAITNTSYQNLKDSDSEPNNGFDNGEDDNAMLILGNGTNSLTLSNYQIRTSSLANSNDVDVISVNSNWTATASASWISLSKVTGTNGTTTISIALSKNANALSRFGTVTVSGGCGVEKIIKIKQAGQDECPTVNLSSNNPFCNDQLKLYANLVPATSRELVTNGNFEKGNVDFSPEDLHYYDWTTGGTLAYIVSANPKTENGSAGMWFIRSECPGENTNPNCQIVNRVRILYRNDCCLNHLYGSKIQGSNNKSTWVDLYTFGDATGNWQDININNSTKYTYVRFVSGVGGFGELREIEFYNGTTKLSGQVFGSTGLITGKGIENATDGLESTLWQSSENGENAYVGLELVGCSLTGNLPSSLSGTGKQMVVAASWTLRQSFWSQTILVDPNTDYTISVKAVQLGNYDTVPVQLVFDVDGVQTTAQGNISTIGCNWQKISGVWNSGEKFGPVKLTLRFGNPNQSEKVFAIDDISVKSVTQGVVSNTPITYSWTAPTTTVQNDLLLANSANPVVNNIKAKHSGVYTLTVSQNGCPITESIDVDIACSATSCPSPKVQSPYASVCVNMNQKATLNAIGCPIGSTVKWSDGQISTPQSYPDPSTGIATTISTVFTAQIKQSTYYYAQCQTDCGLSGKSNDLLVHAMSIPDAPKINAGSSIEKFPGDDGTVLSASGCTNGVIKWSNGITGSSTWISALGYTIGNSVQVTAKCVTECGESVNSSPVNIFVGCNVSNPSYAKTTEVPSCGSNGGYVTLEGACNRGNVVWYQADKASLVGSGNTIRTYISDNTTFNVRCELSSSCVSTFVSIPVTVGGKPNAPQIISDPISLENLSVLNNIKVNTSVLLTANNCPVGSTVSWTITGDSLKTSTEKTITLKPRAVGQIIAKAFCNGGQCSSDPSTITINVVSISPCIAPNWSVSANTVSLPLNSVKTLKATGCTGGSLKWFLAGVEKTSTNTGSSIDVSVNTSTQGAFDYTAVCSIGNCTFTKIVSVSVTPCRFSATTSLSNQICGSTDIQATVLKDSIAYSNVSYAWYFLPANSVPNTTDGTLIGTNNKITVLQDGTYKVKVVDLSNSNCFANSTWTPVTINSSPNSDFNITPTGSTLSLNKGQSQILSTSGCIGGTVEWYLDGVKQISKVASTSSQSLEINVNTSLPSNVTTTYKYFAKCTLGNCTAIKSINVTVNPISCNYTVSLAKTNEVCGSTTLSASVSIANNQYQYKWYYKLNSTATENMLASTTASINVSQSGMYKVEVYNENNCKISSVWLSIDVMKGITQTPTAGGSTTINKGSSTSLSASGCPANSTYTWSNGSTGSSISVSPTETTSYTVKCRIVGNNAICESSISNVVTVTVSCSSTPPVLEYSSPTSKVCIGATIIIKAACSGTVKWYDSSTSNTSIATGSTYTTNLSKIWATCTQSGSTCESAKASIETQIDFGTVSITPNCDFNRLDVTPSDMDAYSYVWKKSNTLLDVTTPYLANIITTGTYNVVITRKGSSCSQSTAYTLSDLSLRGYPSVVFNTTEYCGSVKLSTVLGNKLLAPGPYKYKWFKENNPLDIVDTTSIATFTNSGLYKVAVTANNGCFQMAEKNQTVDTKPITPTISKSSNIYYSGSSTGVLLTANCTVGTTPQWNDLSSQNTLTVKPSATTTYKVRCLKGICSSDWAETSVTYQISPTPPAICGKVIEKGTNAYYTESITYSGSTGKLSVKFETFCVPDKIVLSVGGKIVVSSDCMGSGATPQTGSYKYTSTIDIANYNLDVKNGDVIKVEVYPSCTTEYVCPDNTSSSWRVTFGCVSY